MLRTDEHMNILTTERLMLRPFTLKDKEFLFKLHSDPIVMQYVPSGVQTRAEALFQLREDIAHQQKYGFSKWAMFLKYTGEFIGRAGWAWMETNEVEVGFKLLPEYWNNGFATEVLKGLLTWGKANIQFPLIAFAYPENKASINVLVKAGMIYLRQDNYGGKQIIVYSIPL